MRSLAAAILVIGLAFGTTAHANLINGGGFNSESDLAFWSLGGASLPEISGFAFGLGPQEGDGYLAFTGNSSQPATPYGFVDQVINGLTAGQNYSFSYYFGGRGGNSTSAFVQAAISTIGSGISGDIYNATHISNDPAGTWNLVTASFTAVDSSAFLTFQETSTNSQNVGPAIDNASITAVPTPATLALVGCGLAGLGLIRRKKA